VAASRLSIAAVVLLAIAFARMRGVPRLGVTRRQALVLGVAGVALAIHFATWIASLQYTSVAISTLLVASTPIWTSSYDALARKRRLSPWTLAAFAAGAIGLWAIVGANAVAPPIRGHALLGAGLAIAGSVAIAAYLLLVREVRAVLDTRIIVTHTYAWAAVVLVVAAAIAHQPPPPLSNASAWAGILGMALISQLLGHTAINAALRWFSPSTVSFTTLLEPMSAAILALIVFGERLPAPAVAGGLIVLVAIGIVLREDRSTAVVDELL
jgi:drug/metabolite transporter (DMT)-like permease